ncbi:MAG: LysE family translocator [Gammaproteobacteria bacterium]|jgi:threonine/homoserine/homoserine lactone efflux protein|uniref:Threonine/homoserine/homoserine lactone efflux protein n=1 Tax=Marinomonas polaris DSM 16579 TaxID=1122206 RepID=A0A1M4UNY3_9GAMM|nr:MULTISPECIES: LysE family translocator [Marinomonas]MBU1295996.1 LysE family translocator [Gammaproteobacteria bacterium]MBU1468997.1 LysE family translocator [Gammaproteobacteria bacterium]MBU2023652.1 LysE family translocator [Gammaproteobacteria bacterium]MBU2238657.1 LysE family translocator [Gammaproteobacteria bacterium]MBU2320443.1 LysE family translocator [Gammaproteobacteria bacterium]|tara:strand:+ start:3159 stop:3779 length:621 start_codon:yes stop_codon:yes gene_type:complete
MDLTTWLSLVAVCVMGAISPGPSLAVILRVSVSQSPLHGVLAAITHGLGIGFWAFLTLQGLAILMAKHQNIFSVLTVLGGLYLAWLGFKAWRYAGQGHEIKVEGQKSSYWESARDGMMISLMNPKAALFFLALFSQLIPTEINTLIKFQLWATVVVIDTGWYVIVALLLAGGPVLSWLRRHTVWVDRSMGSILILLGLKVVIGAFA